MNQILDYSPNKGNKNSSGSDKIVHVFAVIMIIFAIALIAGACYNLYKNNKDNKKNIPKEEKALIQVVQEDSQAILKVTHTKVIEKIIYSWNNGKETTIKGSGEKNIDQIITLPAGENNLQIKVIDIDGGEATYEGSFASQSGEDILNPVIKLEITDEKKLRIIATDETSLDFITYRWNDEEEVKVEVSEDKNKIVKEIDILKGVNDLTISAVDSNNNTTTETKNFTGLIKPDVIIVVAADKKSVDVTVKHEKGLKEVKVNLNDVEYPVALGEQIQTEIMFNVALAEGVNKMVVTAVSLDDTQTIASEEVNNIPEQVGEPEISIEKTEDGSVIYKVNCPKGIKELKLNINDMDMDLSSLKEYLEQNNTYIEFLAPLYDGKNKIRFTVIPTEGTEKQEIKEFEK